MAARTRSRAVGAAILFPGAPAAGAAALIATSFGTPSLPPFTMAPKKGEPVENKCARFGRVRNTLKMGILGKLFVTVHLI